MRKRISQNSNPVGLPAECPFLTARLVVQAKLRTGDAWTVAGIKSLLKYGSEGLESAAKRLSDPDVCYLLVTSAALNGLTRGLSVRRAGAWPKPETMPTTIAKALPVGAAGRVGIVGNFDEERLASEIKRLLTKSFRVPNARWAACRRALGEEARIRIRSAGSGRWGEATWKTSSAGMRVTSRVRPNSITTMRIACCRYCVL